MNAATSALVLCGEELLLHPQRAVIWPRLRTVIVADTHFGKSSVFGRNGMAVPAGADDVDRSRLAQLLGEFAADRLVVLGDFLHEPLRADSDEAQALDVWTESLGRVKIQVVAGNHDRGTLRDGVRGWRGDIDWVAGEHFEPPFLFVHDSSKTSATHRAAFAFSGHIHPVISLGGLRKKAARVPAFWLRPGGLILPSFGLFTGGYRIEPGRGEQIFAVSPERVVPFPPRA